MTASFDSYSQQDQLIHVTAAKICLRYMEQINRLDENEVEDFAIHVSERIVDYIKAGKFQTTGDLAKDTDELAIVVANHELRHGALSLSKKSVAHNGADKQSWNVEGALSKPGIIILDENGKPHYYSKNGEPPKYGYMLGTQEEVDHWKMKAVAPEKIPSQHPITQLHEKSKKGQATTEIRKSEEISQSSDPSVITPKATSATNINRAFKDIAQDIKNGLNKYKKHREENVRLKIYDTFSNSTRDYDSRDNRIKTVTTLLEQLEELKSKKDATPNEYVQFLQKLSKEADQITDNNSLLKKTLIKLYDKAVNDLKSIPGTENISEFKLACNKANTNFNNRMLRSLAEYSQNRQFASTGGFVNQLKSLYYNGVVNTAREGVLEDVKKKNEHIALAEYCSHQIKQCEQAKPEDKIKAYVNLMISCAEMLQRLKKDSSNNGELDKYLQTYQKMIWKRFAENNKDPAFSLENKKAIYHALKSYNNKDNADLLKKIEQSIENEEKGYIADTAKHPTKQSIETLQKKHGIHLDGFINDINRKTDKTKQQQQDFQQIFKQQLHARFISTLAVHSGKITDHTVLSKAFSRISDTIDSDSAIKKNKSAVDTVKSFEYLEKLMNKVSEKTIERYAEQINFLDGSSVNKVAIYAAERAMAYIKSGKFNSTGDIEKDTAAIVQGITIQELHHGAVPLFNKRIAHNKGTDRHYSAEGFFAKPGIVCLGDDGKIKFYNNDGAQPTKYGYIFATEKEALDRGMKIVTTDMNKSEAEKNNHPAYKIGLQKQSELIQSSIVTHSAPESSEKLPSDIAPPSIRLRAVTTTPHVQRNHDLPITESSRKTESTGTSRKYCDRHPNDVQKITKVISLNPPPSAPKSVITPIVLSTIVTPLSSRPRGGSMR